jgi:hypothetical protein
MIGLKTLIYTAGIIEVLVGLLHFFMPLFFDKSEAFSHLPMVEMDYLLLVTYAVGILLVAFGTTTILFARRHKALSEVLYLYLMIQTILWTVRVILEFLYPVGLEMFTLKPFTLIVMPGLIFEWGLFLYITILIRKKL